MAHTLTRSLSKVFSWKRLAAATLLVTSQFALPSAQASSPDEGMWLPLFIKRLNHEDMQKKGLKLTADELYSINNHSIKDAIVSLGGFCTGEIISPEGLLLTNHHCGYESIQQHSSVEHDYLTDGFWAMNKKEEKANPGLFVTFLVRMEDVTTEVLSKVNPGMGEAERKAAISAAMKAIEAKVEQQEASFGYKAAVRPFFDGNQYFLFVNQVFEDVRLVGAPPSSVGKYGGDTDNWMWPRHTGDFSMFRVYMGPDGKPAKYSPDNVPLKPRHYLPISLNGVKEGDFTMIFGYPGRTNRYLTSWGVALDLSISHPTRISIRERKLALMKKDMDVTPSIRIMYASKYAQISNYWKYFIGQSAGLKRLKVVDKKRDEEKAFDIWVKAEGGRQTEYGTVLTDLAAGYDAIRKYQAARMVYSEWASNGPASFPIGVMTYRWATAASAADAKAEDVEKNKKSLESNLEEMFKESNLPTEEKLFALHLKAYQEFVAEDQWPAVITTIKTKYKGDVDKYVAEVFKKSSFTTKEKAMEALKKGDAKKILQDPLVQVANDILMTYTEKVTKPVAAAQANLDRANRLYVAGTMLRDQNRKFYPNANSTMRMTYGQVLAYEPKDGVKYDYLTTLDGVMEKEDPTNEEFIVPAKLKALYQKKDYGRYGQNGKLPCSFISNNDITGGNSGSPVINAYGDLIGTAYDGNWEAMSGDIAFEPEFQRTISVDIRYTLFIIDKYAGAKHLVDEMKLVERMDPVVVPPTSVPLPTMAPAAPAINVDPATAKVKAAKGKPAAKKVTAKATAK